MLYIFDRYLDMDNTKKNERKKSLSRVGRLLSLKCPKCGQTKVFNRAKFPGARPKIKETCDNCGYRFNKEQGYFRGAVYLSYGLTLLEGVLAIVFAKMFVFGLTDRELILVGVAAMLFFSIWNYKIARVLWLNIFPDKTDLA
jgi:uncharacterized protein (DUF983 family)